MQVSELVVDLAEQLGCEVHELTECTYDVNMEMCDSLGTLASGELEEAYKDSHNTVVLMGRSIPCG